MALQAIFMSSSTCLFCLNALGNKFKVHQVILMCSQIWEPLKRLAPPGHANITPDNPQKVD